MEPTEDVATRLLRDLLVPKNQNQEITIHHANPPPAPPAPPWHAYVGACGAVVCVLITVFAVDKANTAQSEVRALRAENSQRLDSERFSREIMSNWTSQEITALRSYITTGKLAPMSARPIAPQQEKH